jgi:hypothetical protein
MESYVGAIKTISGGIVSAAYFFAANKAPFDEGNYPSEKWGKGVGGALSAFAPVFQALSDEDIGFVSDMVTAIDWITKGMIISAANFTIASAKSGGKIWDSYPSEEWANGVGTAIQAFASSIGDLKDNIGSDIPFFFNSVTLGMLKMSTAFDRLGKAITGFGSAINSLDTDKVSLFTAITGHLAILSAVDEGVFGNIMDVLDKRADVFLKLTGQSKASEVKWWEKVSGGNIESPAVTVKSSGYSTSTPTSMIKKDSRGQSDLDKLDIIIGLLTNINNEVRGLDEYLNKVNPNADLGESD